MTLKTILHNFRTDNIGFFYGNTGISYLLNGNYLPDIDEYLEKLNFEDFSFSRGISGVGWVLQTLIEDGKSKSKYNKLLVKIDDLIYKEVTSKKTFLLSLFSPSSLLAKSLYLYQRVTSKINPISNYYSHIACKECLYLLTSEICELLAIIKTNQDTILKKRADYYLEVGQCFVFLYLCMKSGINEHYVQFHLRDLKLFIESIVNQTEYINHHNAHFLFYLIYAYSFVALDMSESAMISQCNIWEQIVNSKIEQYLESFTDYKLLHIFLKRSDLKIRKMMRIKNKIIEEDSFFLWDYLYLDFDNNPNNEDVSRFRAFLLG